MKKKKLEKKQLNDKEILVLTLTIVVFIITIVLVGATLYGKKYNITNLPNGKEHKEYKYHYMMIGQGADSEFFQDVYEGAKKEGIKNNILIENLSESLQQPYTTKDMIGIAIAAKVDGIILEGDGSKELDEMINKASESNIPVITILKDNPQSKRKSYVGINDYKLGQMYGNQIMNIPKEGILNVTVLMEEKNEIGSPNLIFSGMKEMVLGSEIKITPIGINHKEPFSSEETIRSLLLDENETDVMICLTAIDSICASQAVIDYNAVGEIDIIGYYYSDVILSAIEKKVMVSSISVETKEIGEKAIDALFTYKKNKRVTEYIQVDAQLITNENVEEYRKGGDN